MIKTQLQEAIKKTLIEQGVENPLVQIETPANLQFGDYSSNAALAAAKQLGKSPREVAENIVKSLGQRAESLGLEKIDIAGPGFINFWIGKSLLVEKISTKSQGNYKIANIGNGKNVVVEYSSPNIAKPFTIGHLRSTIIGDAIANLLDAIGYTVYRDNHLGDWGTQFGKQIYAIKTWGNEEQIEKSGRPVKELVDLYVKFHEEAEKQPELEDEARLWFKRLEDGDPEARRLWQKCIDWSWKEFNTIYKQLGVSFTENNGRGYGESYFEDKMDTVIAELEQKALLKEGKEGAKIVEFDESTKLPPLMILKKDGATLYATRDLATDKFRLEKYGKDVTIINEVGIEQELYFRQLIMLEQMIGWISSGQKVHIKHGLYRFKEGKMSTRKGNVIWLEDVLEEAKNKAWNLRNTLTGTSTQLVSSHKTLNSEDRNKGKVNMDVYMNNVNAISIGAIKWNDLKRDASQDVTFDWDDILNMQGNSGPYMQYAYVRTRSVLEKWSKENKGDVTDLNFEIGNLKLENEETYLLRILYKYEEVVVDAAEKYSPNILCNYLFELAQAFNLFYQKLPILKVVISNEVRNLQYTLHAGDLSLNTRDDNTRNFRLALTAATGQTIKTGLNLLGIQAPEQM